MLSEQKKNQLLNERRVRRRRLCHIVSMTSTFRSKSIYRSLQKKLELLNINVSNCIVVYMMASSGPGGVTLNLVEPSGRVLDVEYGIQMGSNETESSLYLLDELAESDGELFDNPTRLALRIMRHRKARLFEKIVGLSPIDFARLKERSIG